MAMIPQRMRTIEGIATIAHSKIPAAEAARLLISKLTLRSCVNQLKSDCQPGFPNALSVG